MAEIYGANKEEFVTSLACIALYDGGAEISADNIKTLLAASNHTVAPYWPGMFAGFLENGKAEELIFSTGGGAVAVAGAGPGAGGDGEGAAEAPKEEKPKVEEVDALEGGMDMFGGGGGGGDY